MVSNKSKLLFSAILTAAGIIVFGFTMTRAVLFAPQEGVPSTSPSSVQQDAKNDYKLSENDHPQRIIIPALNIKAEVEPVGKNSKGNMAAPSNYQDVSWYKPGIIPGEFGSAVIAGHVDNGLGLNGVFKKLNRINIGDEIMVQSRAGNTLVFVVENIGHFPYDKAPNALIFNRNDAVRLNLITCDGTWVDGAETYNTRLVVFSKLKTP